MFLTTILAVVASISLLLVFRLLALRRLNHHPLSRHPGPPLAALTQWYKAYYDIVKDGGWAEHLESLHGIYGIVSRPHYP